ncbi:MAG: HEAT repeat domain-containing protein [bacterium]
MTALRDRDTDLKAWAAGGIGEIGPEAANAVPVLASLLSDSYAGTRHNACIALGQIEPAARDALPMVRRAVTIQTPPSDRVPSRLARRSSEARNSWASRFSEPVLPLPRHRMGQAVP